MATMNDTFFRGTFFESERERYIKIINQSIIQDKKNNYQKSSTLP